MVKIKKLFQFNFILSCGIFISIGCNRSSSTFTANNPSSEESRIGFESKNLPILNKNNLETLMVGRNKIEIEEVFGPPEGKSLDGGNDICGTTETNMMNQPDKSMIGVLSHLNLLVDCVRI